MTASNANAFDWIPFYEELADKLLPFQARQQQLIAFLEELRAEGIKITPLDDKDETGARSLLAEIDPFTFYGSFNRGITEDSRIRILKAVKAKFNIIAALPSHFAGIPILNNQNSWFFSYRPNRKPGDIAKLWAVFKAALNPTALLDPAFAQAFDEALEVRGTNFNLTFGLFWIRPNTFLNLDSTMREFLSIPLPKEGLTFSFYRSTLEQVRASHKTDIPHLSCEAWEAVRSAQTKPSQPQTLKNSDVDYWMVGAFWDSEDSPDQTDRFLAENIWENGYQDRYLDLVNAMKVGDRIAIKAVATQKNDLPFDNGGKTASVMRIKALGTIVANDGNGRTVEVDWEAPLDPPRVWYFYTGRSTVWKLRKDDPFGQALIRFAFQGEPQDYSFFLSNPAVVLSQVVEPASIDTSQSGAEGHTPPYAVADLITDGAFLEEAEIERVLKRLQLKKNLILQGAPGVGKTFLAKRFAYALMEAKDDSRITAVQFHPSYTYEDFVRGYRPSAEVAKFTLVDGPFVKLCENAEKDADRKYVLLIDEINRGNVSQIFGELIMLLEADKRGKEHSLTPLYRNTEGERLHIPANLYVIGTMNIADRSLALVDYALRRRFAFVTLEPQFDSSLYRTWLKSRGMPESLIQLIVTRMKALNTRISEDPQLGEAFCVGHSFFCPTGKDFSSLDTSWYAEVVRTEIKPLLEEYWYDAREKARAACEELVGSQ
jgi:5-methylcytosine-specific restriction protein B